jgi:CheY-like chemotaxis protein
MKRILILEPDEQAAAELSAAVEGRAACEVLLATNVREACLYVAQQPVDVAFVPLAQADDARRALHMLQPELALAALYFRRRG